MKQITQLIARASVATIVSVGLTGVALADSVDLNTTGPNSTNDVTVSNIQSSSVTNTNMVEVINANAQSAGSGNVDVSGNTTVGGGVGSGDASNTNATTTSVGIDNGTSNVNVPTGGTGGATGGTTVPVTTPAGTGSVLGASIGGQGGATASVATLPEVGASVPVDVSALRALYHPSTGVTPTAALVNGSRTISALFLGIAGLLSLIGAGLSTVYMKRRQRGTV